MWDSPLFSHYLSFSRRVHKVGDDDSNNIMVAEVKRQKTNKPFSFQAENGLRDNDIKPRVSEWEVIQEAGVKLKPMYGPGYTGMKNLGNSCYLNAVMQAIFSIPEFQRA